MSAEPCCPPDCCDMRGMLSFIILWLLSRKEMYGSEIAREIALYKGEKPNPGTIYPALRELERKKLIKSEKRGRNVGYSLTKKGKEGLKEAVIYFRQAYGDIVEDYERVISL
jgi:PadR family transcriptional regulator PadR